jgi:hypothetical protein
MRTQFSNKEHTDSGLALILIMFISFLYFKMKIFILAGILVTLLTMIYSPLILPFTMVWLNLSHLLGTFMSRVLLTLVFLVFVVPLAYIRRWMGKDSLLLKKFKKDNSSVFVVRNHTFSKADIEKPY